MLDSDAKVSIFCVTARKLVTLPDKPTENAVNHSSDTNIMNSDKYVIGIDFGSDSARAVIVNCADGSIVGESVSFYKRWKQGLFCDPLKSQFRHHPQDYIDAIESAVGSVTCLLYTSDAADE